MSGPSGDERWKRIEQLYQQAMEQPRERREQFITDATADDNSDEVREEVLRLLRASDDDPSFLESPPLSPDTMSHVQQAIARQSVDMWKGRRIGRYTIIDLLGEGGMGAVWLAEQDQPRRNVALKLIRSSLTTPSAVHRFLFEGEVLGRLEHEGIARIYEAGTAEVNGVAQPYIAMEKIDGEPATQFVRERNLPTRERLQLMARICDAVHFAHQRGVIHRDLKPSNILIAQPREDFADGTYSAVPKILDFGVARLTDDSHAQATLHATQSALLGTLAYMSPEAMSGDSRAIDTRSDVYALGVILYELLSGQRPIETRSTSLADNIRHLTDSPLRALSKVDAQFAGDVELIVMKAMARDRDQRYHSAAAMADDIRRYLAHEPVAARPPSLAYQTRLFARRHRGLVTAAAVVCIAVIIGVVGIVWQARIAQRNADRAQNINVFLSDILTLVRDPEAGLGTSFLTVLNNARDRVPDTFGHDPLGEARVREVLGDAYYRLGRVEDALGEYQRCYTIRQRELGSDDEQTIGALSGIGMATFRLGDLDVAEATIRQVIDARTRIIGPTHQKTLGSMNDLANIYAQQGRIEEAEAMFRNTWYKQQRALGETHRDTLVSAMNLAGLLRTQERFDEAEPIYRDHLRIMEDQFGDDNPDTLRAMDNLAVFLRHAGKPEEAEPFYRRAVSGFARVLGADHPSTLTSQYNFATFLWGERRRDEALDLLADAAATCLRTRAPDDNLAVAVRLRYASYLKREDRYETAEAQLRSLLDGLRASAGDSADSTQRVLLELIDVYDRQDKEDEAAALRPLILEDDE